MNSVSESVSSTGSQRGNSLWLFAMVSVVFITIYFVRFLQVKHMRELMFQRRNFSYITVSSHSSKLQNNGNWLENPGIKISLPLEFHVKPGMVLEVIGSIDTKVQSFYSEKITLTGRSIRQIPRKHNFVLSLFYEACRLLEEFPREATVRLSGVLERSQAALLAGMVFGGSQGLPRGVLEDMKNTGLLHITAASGFNVVVLIGFSLSLFTRLVNRRMASILCLITVISYSVMAGLTPPITRAALMGSLYLFSFLLGKQYSALRSLGLACAIMLIYQPFLIFSVSFLLSAASTLGVMMNVRLFRPIAPREGIWGALVGLLEENLKITLSVLLFTTPILIKSFGTFSLVAPLANAILLWMVAPLTLAGMGLSLVVFISPLLSGLLSLPLSFFLEVFLRSVHLFSNLPFAILPITAPRFWGILAWYACLSAYLAARWQKHSESARVPPFKKK